MSDFKQESIDHWKYTGGIIKILTKEYSPSKEVWMELTEYLSIKKMIHGYKHGKED